MFEPWKRQEKVNRGYEIYALIDPRDNLVSYVGLSISAEVRFVGHLKGSSGNKQEKHWILELQQEGLRPILQILETVEAGSDAYAIVCEEELYWIREMVRLGHPLLNLSGLSRTYVPAVTSKPHISEIQNITLHHETKLEIDTSQVVDIVDVSNTDSALDMPQGANWLTTEEIARDLKVNVNTVRRWIQSGELVALDVGGEYRVSREDYEAFVQRRKTDKRK